LAPFNDEAAAAAALAAALVTRVRVTHQIQEAQVLLLHLLLPVVAFQAHLQHQVAAAQVQQPQQAVAQQCHYRRTVKRLKI
tara:strand:- start:988 stop:1230 length:243 start_codon:yes stop_codon:yes gene_type:complete